MRRLAFPAALLAFLPLYLLPLLPGGRTYEVGYDVMDALVYPLWQGRLRRKGFLALWNPWSETGVPHAAAIVGMVFSPLTYITALTSEPWGVALADGVHAVVGATGIYLFLLRLLTAGQAPADRRVAAAAVGATAFLLSGWWSVHRWAGHATMVRASAFTPWGLLALEIGGAFGASLLGLSAGMTILSGAADLLVFAPIVWGGYALLRPRARLPVLLGGALLGSALGAPQWIPTLELIPRSIRLEAALDPLFTRPWALPPHHLLSLLVPGAFGWLPDGTYYGASSFPELWAYPGLVVLLLAAGARGGAPTREGAFFALLAAGSVLISLGDFTPLWPALLDAAPVVGLFRRPVRYLYLLSLALPVLAAAGFAAGAGRARPRLGAALVALGGVAFLLREPLGAVAAALLRGTDAAEAGGAALGFLPLVRSAATEAALLGLFLLLPRRPTIALLLVTLDLLPWTASLHRVRPLGSYLPPSPPAVARGLSAEDRMAVLALDPWFPGFDVWYEVSTVGGADYYALTPSSIVRLRAAAASEGTASALWDRIGVRRFVRGAATEENPDARPIAIRQDGRARYALEDDPNRFTVSLDPPPGRAEIVRVAVTWDPGWQAVALPGGATVPVRPDPDGLIEAEAPPGSRLLLFRYAPAALGPSLLAAAAALGLIVASAAREGAGLLSARGGAAPTRSGAGSRAPAARTSP